MYEMYVAESSARSSFRDRIENSPATRTKQSALWSRRKHKTLQVLHPKIDEPNTACVAKTRPNKSNLFEKKQSAVLAT